MAFLQKSLEPLTALGCGLAAGAAGVLDGGLAAGAVVGLAGLISRFREGCTRHGLDEPALLKKMQMQMLREWDQHDLPQADRDIITLADAAMAKHLPDCMLSRAELANTSVDADEPYPQKASRLIADQLAKRDAIFSVTLAKTEPLARRFARAAVESALNLAREDKDYAILLTVDLLLAGNRAHAVTHGKLDEIMALLNERGQPQGVPADTVLAIARRVCEVVSDTEGAIGQIHAAIDELISLREAASRGSNLGSLVDEAIRRIAERNAANDFDAAAREGEAAFAALAEKQAELIAAKFHMVETNISQSRIRADAKALARWTTEHLKLEQPTLIFSQLHNAALKMYEHAVDKGLPLDIESARWLAQDALAIADDDRKRGLAHDLIGAIELQSGDWIEGDAGLERMAASINALDRALQFFCPEADGNDWLLVQDRRGNALKAYGMRVGGERGRKLLVESVAALRLVLSRYDREKRPFDWAGALNGLGIALNRLARETDGADGFEMLREAIAAFKQAAEIYRRDTSPESWAKLQNNSGNVFRSQAERAIGNERLDLFAAAVGAYELALAVRPRQSVPFLWAMTKENIGMTLFDLAVSDGSIARREKLEQAIAALDDALDVYRTHNLSHYHRKCSLVREGAVGALEKLSDKSSPS